MPQFAANLTMLFTEHPFLERFAAAAQAGFRAVELMFPYAYEISELQGQLQQHDLELVMHNLPCGDWEVGERGIACLPDREHEFRESVGVAMRYALALGVKQVNCLIGKTPTDASPELVHATVIKNLRYAARRLASARLKLLIEPVNTLDVAGFYLSRTQQALALLDEVDEANVFIQYDVYHAQRMEGELGNTLQKHLSRIGHIQLADNPGRHEPGTGEINYRWLFQHLDAIGYTGWVGCEYKPKAKTSDGLAWRTQLLA